MVYAPILPVIHAPRCPCAKAAPDSGGGGRADGDRATLTVTPQTIYFFSKFIINPMDTLYPCCKVSQVCASIRTTMESRQSKSVGTDDALVESAVEIPDWLEPAPRSLAKSPPEVKALALAQYEFIFMRVIDSIAHGNSLSQILRDDQRDIDYNDFYRWIKKNPERNQLFTEAQEMRTEFMAGEIIEIADADDSLEDVQRSRLKIDTRKWLMGAHNRKKYGEIKTVELGGSISITEALAQANARLVDADVVDVTPRLEN